MPALAKIPINQQETTAIGGLDIWHLTDNDTILHADKLEEHRDDYYVLILAIKGSGIMKCDMESIHIRPKSILLVKPYQVHSRETISKDVEAYFISIAPFLVPDFCRTVFENTPISNQCLKLSGDDMKRILKVTELLYQAFKDNNIYKTYITNNLFNALVIHLASLFSVFQQKHDHKKNQAFSITQKFKELVSVHSFLHSASFFSEKLHISTSHLNDCLKTTTGMSVTQFLQQAMLLEAKRNLYYTNADVKKIAFDMGFEDHTYFSRLFKKLTRETPLAFRNKFRE